MSFSIKEIILTWREERGGIIPYVRGDKSVRIGHILDLFASLELNGYEINEITSNLTRAWIVGACTSEGSKKIKQWKEAVNDDIDRAIAQFNPSPTAQFDSKNKKIKTVEIPPEHRVIPEKKVEKNEIPEESGKPLTPALDRSIFDGVPKPEIEYDEDFRKLMGFDK